MSKKKKNKAIKKAQFFWKPLPKIDGLCGDCDKFESGTACDEDALWCYRNGIITLDFANNCKACPFFKKKWQFKSGKQADFVNFNTIGGI